MADTTRRKRVTSHSAASAAAKVLRTPRTSKAAKSAAGSALSKKPIPKGSAAKRAASRDSTGSTPTGHAGRVVLPPLPTVRVSPELAQRIDPDSLCRYAKAAGWGELAREDDFVVLGRDRDATRLVLPMNAELVDYVDRLRDVIDRLAAFEGCAADEILRRVDSEAHGLDDFSDAELKTARKVIDRALGDKPSA
jgi:hypothetical protein